MTAPANRPPPRYPLGRGEYGDGFAVRLQHTLAEKFGIAKAIRGYCGQQTLDRSLTFRNASLTLLETLLFEILVRRELLPDGKSWLADVDAERAVLYGLCSGEEVPAWFDPAFTIPFHAFLFKELSGRKPQREDRLTAEHVVGIALLAEHGTVVFERWTKTDDRRTALGWERTEAIDAIFDVAGQRQPMQFKYACSRVHKLGVRRKLHRQTIRLTALLEQATVDPKEMWREQRILGELMTKLTGDDGRSDGW
jgi:hypothetical protein